MGFDNSLKAFFRFAAASVLTIALGVNAQAQSISQTAKPVTAFQSTTQVPINGLFDHDEPGEPLFNPATGLINYYNPISSITSGRYGVDHLNGVVNIPNNTLVGTYPENFPSNQNGGMLTMYLAIGPITAPVDMNTARLRLDFEDLDLTGLDDGGTFRETIRIIGRNGDTGVLDNKNDTGPLGEWTISGNSSSQHIVFNNVAFLDNLNGASNLFLEIRFGTLAGFRSNTSEEITATLQYDHLRYTVSGHTKFADGTLVPGASIVETGLGSKITDANGFYNYTNVANGSYSFLASKAGYVVTSTNPRNVSVAGANVTDVDFILSCAAGYIRQGANCVAIYNISGGAYFDGTTDPIAGVTITSTGGLSAQSTAANGSYSFTGVLNGSYTLSAAKTGYVVVSQNFTNPVVVNGANQVNKNFFLACAAGYARSGNVCLPVYAIGGHAYRVSTTTPIAGVGVQEATLGNRTTDGAGAYSYSSVFAGSYTLNATAPGPEYVVVGQSFTNPVSVSAIINNLDFFIDCAAGFAWNASNACVAVQSISGKVLFTGTNAPVPGATVTSTGGLTSQTSAADGSYQFVPVLPGSYTLGVSKAGVILVSQSISNPVIVAGVPVIERNFYLGCPTGQVLSSNGTCVTPETITVDASDGTYRDFVLVTWTTCQNATSYTLYRSDTAGPLGSVLASGLTGTPRYEDRSAVPETHYFYTAECNNGTRSNQDEGWRPRDSESCPPGQECINEDLEPTSCASANAFLGQINIATVINRRTTPLSATVQYRDWFGQAKGSVTAVIQPLQKRDFIVNGPEGLGLEQDSYGTLCVKVDTTERGAWSGGLTLYKMDTRDGNGSFGNGASGWMSTS